MDTCIELLVMQQLVVASQRRVSYRELKDPRYGGEQRRCEYVWSDGDLVNDGSNGWVRLKKVAKLADTFEAGIFKVNVRDHHKVRSRTEPLAGER